MVVDAFDSAAVSDSPADSDKDWSGGATTLDMMLPAGSYVISAQGCTGDQIASTQIAVTLGFHVDVDMDSSWEMPKFLDHACPRFGTALQQDAG
jgi:hypothetical protein